MEVVVLYKKRSTPVGLLHLASNMKVGRTHAKNEIMTRAAISKATHFVFVYKYNKKNKTYNMKAFSTLQQHGKYMYVDLLCNSKATASKILTVVESEAVRNMCTHVRLESTKKHIPFLSRKGYKHSSNACGKRKQKRVISRGGYRMSKCVQPTKLNQLTAKSRSPAKKKTRSRSPPPAKKRSGSPPPAKKRPHSKSSTAKKKSKKR